MKLSQAITALQHYLSTIGNVELVTVRDCESVDMGFEVEWGCRFEAVQIPRRMNDDFEYAIAFMSPMIQAGPPAPPKPRLVK